jgi:hypothetical protein
MIAYAFLQNRRLTKARRKKKNQRTSASAKLASGTPRYRRSHASTVTLPMSVLPKMDQRGTA